MRRVVCFVALTAVVACGGKTANDRGNGATTGAGRTDNDPMLVAVEDLVDAILSDYCYQVFECGFGRQYRDETDCGRAVDFAMVELQASLDRGAVIYDPAALLACREWFLSSPCAVPEWEPVVGDMFQTLARCPGALVPQLEEGASCTRSAECGVGLWCDDDSSCPGRCAPRRLEGEPCDEHEACASGLQCTTGTCAPIQAVGSACEDLCRCQTPECPSRLWCNTSTGRCELGSDEGEPCSNASSAIDVPNRPCKPGLWCDAAPDSLEGTCRPPSPPGGPCLAGPLGVCAEGLVCRTLALAELGTCDAPLQEGEPCHDGECDRGLYCREGQCHPLPYPGDLCVGDNDCQIGYCYANTCQYFSQLGEPCQASDVCLVGVCVDGRCEDVPACVVAQ